MKGHFSFLLASLLLLPFPQIAEKATPLAPESTEVLTLAVHNLPVEWTKGGTRRELDQVTESLLRFHPDRIVVVSEEDLSQHYQAYLQGETTPASTIEEQLAFPLSQRAGIENLDVLSVDFPVKIGTEIQESEAVLAGNTLDQFLDKLRAIEFARMNEANKGSVNGLLRFVNQPMNLSYERTLYLSSLTALGESDAYLGPRLLSRWYESQLRLFSSFKGLNLAPGEKVLVLIEAREAAWFTDFVAQDPGLVHIPATSFLEVH